MNLREKDRASFQNPKIWEKGEIALLKLPSKTKPYWLLVRIVDTYPDLDLVICTVKVSKPDGNQVNVNVFYVPALALQATIHSCTRQKGRKDSDGRVQDVGLRIPECL